MAFFNNINWTTLLLTLLTTTLADASFVTSSDIMKCFYGERGSLTATCVNASASFFKSTPYRFDHLDETLKCITCNLTTIERGTFDLSGNQIKILDLTASQIQTLKPSAFIGLIFLKKLYLQNNTIKFIYPSTFSGVKKIEEINLSNNKLEILQNDGFVELINLEILNLSNNNIQNILPQSFNGLVSLKELNLYNNQLTRIKDINQTSLGNLTILNLARNNIATLDGDEFINLTSILEVNLAHNKLVSPKIYGVPTLKNIYLSNNLINSASANFLTGLPSLENIDLSFNSISEVGKRGLQSLHNLRNLDLSFNSLTSFLTGTYSRLPQLEALNCSHNAIQKIEITGVYSWHSLQSLDLSYNRLTDLDYIGLISRLPKLAYLKLEDNSLSCDLEDEMATYFEEDNFKFVLFDNTVGAKKCTSLPTKATLRNLPEKLVDDTKSVAGAEIAIFVLIAIAFVCIGFLFFLQYRTYRDININPTGKAISTANLISEMESRNQDDTLR